MADDIKRLDFLNLLLPIEKTRESRKDLLSKGNIKKRGNPQKEEDGLREPLESESQGEDAQDENPSGKILDIIV